MWSSPTGISAMYTHFLLEYLTLAQSYPFEIYNTLLGWKANLFEQLLFKDQLREEILVEEGTIVIIFLWFSFSNDFPVEPVTTSAVTSLKLIQVHTVQL